MTVSQTQADSQRDFAEVVVRKLRVAGFTALWAGGCVRDLLVGLTPKDYDVATDARPEQVRDVFGRRRTRAVGESFGVIIVLGPNRAAGQIEVATFRNDGQYIDGRRPESVEFSSPEEDARRRDFTINGMFYDPVEEKVLDFVGGETDLKRGVLRAIGTARHRFEEDKLRLLRAVRFAAAFDFTLEEDTAQAAREMASQITVVSAERIAQELRRMLSHRNRAVAIRLCREVNLLPHILPELNAVSGDEQLWRELLTALTALGEMDFSIGLGLLFCSAIDQSGLAEKPASQLVLDAGKRLRLSNDEIHHAEWLVRFRDVLSCVQELSLARLKRVLSEPLAEDLLALLEARLYATGSSCEPVEFCRRFLAENSPEVINPPPLISGDQLIAAGFRPGPRFKHILEVVRDAQLNLEISDSDEAMDLALRIADGE